MGGGGGSWACNLEPAYYARPSLRSQFSIILHAQKLIRLMQRCSLNNAWTMLLSGFNNTCWIHNVDEYCSIDSCSMLTKNNSCYNVDGTWADNSWWKSFLMVVNNDWTMIVEREQLWTMIVEREQLWTIVVDNSCWQGAAQHCNKLLTTLIKLFIFARVYGCWETTCM